MAAEVGRLPGDWACTGNFSAKTMTLPSNVIGDSQVAVGSPIQATKLYHRHHKTWGQPNSAATSETRIIHKAKAAGVLQNFELGAKVAAVGAATVTANLLKNGVSVLSGGTAITINSSTAAYTTVGATITTTAYNAGDVFEIVLTATAGGGTLPTGVFADFVTDEQPS